MRTFFRGIPQAVTRTGTLVDPDHREARHAPLGLDGRRITGGCGHVRGTLCRCNTTAFPWRVWCVPPARHRSLIRAKCPLHVRILTEAIESSCMVGTDRCDRSRVLDATTSSKVRTSP